MLGRNRIKKIERLFNVRFELYSDVYSRYKFGYAVYISTDANITLYFYVRKVCLSVAQRKLNYFKCKEFDQVLQLIHEYLYDSRDNNKG